MISRANVRRLSRDMPPIFSSTYCIPARRSASSCPAISSTVRDHVAAGRLRVVLREYEVPPLPINAVLSHTRLLSNKVRTLVDFLAAQLNTRDFSTLSGKR